MEVAHVSTQETVRNSVSLMDELARAPGGMEFLLSLQRDGTGSLEPSDSCAADGTGPQGLSVMRAIRNRGQIETLSALWNNSSSEERENFLRVELLKELERFNTVDNANRIVFVKSLGEERRRLSQGENADDKRFVWSDSSEKDEDQLGPIPAHWRVGEEGPSMKLNAVVVELETANTEVGETSPADTAPAPEPSKKGKEVAEGEKLPSGSEKETHPSNFVRKASQVPGGGYFAKGGNGANKPPSDDSSSSDSESSSSDSEPGVSDSESETDSKGSESVSSDSSSDSGDGTRKKRGPTRSSEGKQRSKKDAKKTRKLLRGIRTKQPLDYNGVADLDILDQWTYAMDLWIEMNGLTDKWAVKLMINFLSDKASRFYMKHVALNRRKWNVRQVYEGLFDYCFPPDYKLELRKRLMKAYQGRKPFRDFARDIESLARRFPDVSKRQKVQILWDGAQQYIRLKWVDAGCSPESTKWERLIKKASRYEAAEQLRLKEEAKVSRDGRSPVYSAPTSSSQAFRDAKGTKKYKESAIRERTTPKGDRKLSQEKLAQLRAEGKCYKCEKEGHLARNCPLGNIAPAPKISSRTVRLGIEEEQDYISGGMPLRLCCVKRAAGDVPDRKSVSPAIESNKISGGKPRRRTKIDNNGAHDMGSIERTAMRPKDTNRKFPKPIVVEAFINGKATKALIDSGSLADFMSTTLADQLKVKKEFLERPLPLQLAVHGSRSKINCCTTVDFKYQQIAGQRRFDIANLDSYDLILGTPFLYQHKVVIGMNPSRVLIGSVMPVPMEGDSVITVLPVSTVRFEQELDMLRNQLLREAKDLCPNTEKLELPPLRAVNHSIPLIDEKRVYSWRPSRCPEALKGIWQEKRNAYLANGRWRIATGTNASPMLILPKPRKDDGAVRIRTVVDKREQNANTKKLKTPLPDIDTILRNVVRHRYRSSLDGKDAYEQIRIIPEHVGRTLFTTPDGTMESLTLQQGDCNGPATYQTLMNYIFAPYIGVIMDVYLDDIIIYSDSVEDHVKHVRQVLEVLRKERLYLSAEKMNFFADKLNILGHVIDGKGIVMDPHKVTAVTNWKVPTNKGLLGSFLGAVGYLAGDCPGIRIPMGVLTPLTGSNKIWRWGATEQRAFEQIKDIVQEYRDNHRVALNYSPEAECINLVTDACLTGASGTLSQGDDLKTAKVVSFWSGKFSAAQQNYPVHEQELLAIVESLKRFRSQLLGTKFRICTDHKGLEFIMSQRHLSPRQHRWVDVLNEFEFEINYIPGETNVLADALSRIYSDEPLGVVRAASEYVSNDSDEPSTENSNLVLSCPVYTGSAELANDLGNRRSSRLAAKGRVRWDKDHRARAVDLEESDHEAPSEEWRRERRTEKRPAVYSEDASPGPEDGSGLQDLEIFEDGSRLPGVEGVGMTGNFSLPDEDVRGQVGEAAVPPHSTVLDRVAEERRENAELEPIGAVEALESSTAPSLTDIISEGDPGISIPEDLRGRYKEDAFFRKILENPSHFRDFEVTDGLIFLKRNHLRLLCIPDVNLGDRSAREIIINHAHSILAHLGARKTLFYLRENVWWTDIIKDVTDFCASCGLCAMSKSSTQKPEGLLRTIEIPRRPWQSIGIDFVGPLPNSRNRLGEFDQICVIIDHLTSMVHLVPTRTTYRAKDMAEVIFDVVYKLHGLPERIISDRDSLFTSIFWKELHRLLGTDIKLSSSYHPQTDGATERANRTMTQMLRQCVALDQKDWVSKLPAIEYAMNCARSETTGFSPFFLNYGQMPRPFIWESTTDYPGVRVFAQRMKDAIMSAHDEVIEARVKQTRQANRSRRKARFTVGDLVYVSTKNMRLPKSRARKLTPKYIGPFKIIREVTEGSSFEVDLSPELKARGTHPVFHASLLRIHFPNDDRRFPGRQFHQIPGFGDTPREWAIDRVLSHVGHGEEAQFEVLWMTGDITWLEYSVVKHLEPLKAYCEGMGALHPNQLPRGKGLLPPDDVIGLAAIRFGLVDENGFEQKPLGGFSQAGRAGTFQHTSMQSNPNSSPPEGGAILSPAALTALLRGQNEAFTAGARMWRPYPRRGFRGGSRRSKKTSSAEQEALDAPSVKSLPPPLGRKQRGPSKHFKAWSAKKAAERDVQDGEAETSTPVPEPPPPSPAPQVPAEGEEDGEGEEVGDVEMDEVTGEGDEALSF